jgi:hypothetical protein
MATRIPANILKGLVLLMLALVLFMFTGCSQSVVGTYSGSLGKVELKDNGKYVYELQDDDGSVLVSVDGPYKVEGDQVKCWYSDTEKEAKAEGDPKLVFRIKGNALIDTRNNEVYAK